MPSFQPALAFNRFGLGPRPGDLLRIAGNPRAALAAELDEPGVAAIDAAGLRPSSSLILEVRQLQVDRGAAVKSGNVGMVKRAPIMDTYSREVAARMAKIVAVNVGFVERLVAFWTNHFAIAARGILLYPVAGSFEREAIRPHVLGSFRDMLRAVTQHPAMLVYMNNVNSIGPNSPVGKRRNRGLNENHGRELLELHTVGVDGGYTQKDVTSLAAILTGWTVDNDVRNPNATGGTIFRPEWHEPGPATVMGVRYAEGGAEQAEAVLEDIAVHPETARHLAGKLARHFVADEPPAALVENLAATFTRTSGDLKQTALALIDSDAAWESPLRLKTPQEFVWSSLRALPLDVRPTFVIKALASLGQPLWNPSSPKGFSDDSGEWLAPDAMTDRLDLSLQIAAHAAIDSEPIDLARDVLGDACSAETMSAIAAAESRPQGLALLLMSPEFQRR